MPPKDESWLGECAHKSRVTVSRMCLQKESLGWGNVLLKRESWLGECAIKIEGMVSGMCPSNVSHCKKNVPSKLTSVRGMCHKKPVRIKGNVSFKRELWLGECDFKRRVMVRETCLRKESQGNVPVVVLYNMIIHTIVP